MNDQIELKELEDFFKKIDLPKEIQLEQGVFIPNLPSFVDNYLKSLSTGQMALPEASGRFYRLRKLKALLSM
ncbi:DUF6965 family protein [Sediminibacterium ginsengisoli]|uniref:DUF6965 family protein n=1 Tax=Sediminibacterium ginsengisoli TaxID=413434 RepID=UPI00099D0A79|nr:hypothetical protein [Sediminibacterium ginsengisoli]